MRLIDADALKNDLSRFYDGEVTARQLIDEQPTIGGWISVKDRLPEEYGNCLAVVDGEVTECTYFGPFIKGIISGWSTCKANGFKWLRDEHVTCWMPLPEPPKEDNNG